ncbi:hypothetical protein [Maribacter sp. 2304DJ31-5]|uniref:hypothetical protein n=1 Tax=Maribacter sp. 2304DJ31-5 TaxID=3386273 RepID=UPI0039BD90EB
MKLKEIPVSIFKSIALLTRPAHKIKVRSENEVPVIISLTSIPSRLHTLHLVIRSILDQTIHPKKILLWLNESLKNDIPKQLKILEGDLFEIKYSKLTCSHRKLIHTIQNYPDTTVVTCDDDFMYRSDWLQLLYKEHLKNPDRIIANQTRYITYNDEGDLLPYKQWKYSSDKVFNPDAVIPIGAEGVLYPAKVLSEKTTDVDLFLKLTPKADDLWFKAMGLLKKTRSILATEKAKTPIPILGSQKESLKKTNIGADKNREQWLAVTKYFDLNLVQ